MMAAMPLMASAQTTHHSGTDIIGGTSTDAGDLTDEAHTALTGDGHNEFTEYNDPSTTNTIAKTFGTGEGSLGNTRSSAGDIQGQYPVIAKNEIQGYRTSNPDAELDDDLATLETATPFNEQTNDTLNSPANTGVTDLETAIPTYNMNIPAKTVLPIGATHWRLGNVKIEGQYFVRPDKVDVLVSHNDFKHSDYDAHQSEWTDTQKAAHKILFTVSDKALTDAALDGTKHRYFFQKGTDDADLNTFPHAYTAYASTDYRNGKVTDIKETHQVWLNADASEWQGKAKGTYTGNITFAASVVTTDTDTVPTMYDAANLYPGEGHEA